MASGQTSTVAVPDVLRNGKFAANKPHIDQFEDVRRQTELLCAPLQSEDYCLQSMPDASPPKWHLAHSTWFFETFLLTPHCPGYKSFNPAFNYLFNSYYEAV